MKVVAVICAFLMGFCTAYLWLIPYETDTTETTETTETESIAETKEKNNTTTHSAETKAYYDQDITSYADLDEDGVNLAIYDYDTVQEYYDVSGWTYSSSASSLSNAVYYTVSGNLGTITVKVSDTYVFYIYIYVPEGQEQDVAIKNQIEDGVYVELQVIQHYSEVTDYCYSYTTYQDEEQNCYYGYVLQSDGTWDEIGNYTTNRPSANYETDIRIVLTSLSQAKAVSQGWGITIDDTTYNYTKNYQIKNHIFTDYMYKKGEKIYITVKKMNSTTKETLIGLQDTNGNTYWDYLAPSQGGVVRLIMNWSTASTTGNKPILQTDLFWQNTWYMNGEEITTSSTATVTTTQQFQAYIIISTEEIETNDVASTITPLVNTLSTILTTKIFGDYGSIGTIALIMIAILIGAGVLKIFISGGQ